MLETSSVCKVQVCVSVTVHVHEAIGPAIDRAFSRTSEERDAIKRSSGEAFRQRNARKIGQWGPRKKKTDPIWSPDEGQTLPRLSQKGIQVSAAVVLLGPEIKMHGEKLRKSGGVW